MTVGWLWWLACAPAPSVVQAEPVSLRVFLDGPVTDAGGKLVVQAEYGEGELSLPEPIGAQAGADAAELEFTADGPPDHERIGDRNVVTQRYVFRGKPGSYEIPALEATVAAPAGVGPPEPPAAPPTGRSAPLFVDLKVEPPRPGEITDIVEPPVVTRWPWVAVGVVGALFAGGLWLAFRPRRRVEKITPPVPPHLAALQAWEKVRADRGLTIDDKAREVSRIFREYVESVLGFEATSRTTAELLEHLQSLGHLPEGNVPRARRVLRAADRVKFAEERPAGDAATSPEEAWLAELDADLRAFVDSTKPVWTSHSGPRK
ncbi:MAG: hypothetical protein ABMA64_17470 [Myxococcota bacterium]